MPYYGANSYYTHNYIVIGSQAKAIIDCIAGGKNPKSYDRATAGSGEIVKTDLIQELLDLQNRNDGSVSVPLRVETIRRTDTFSLALDAYFGNQNGGMRRRNTGWAAKANRVLSVTNTALHAHHQY